MKIQPIKSLEEFETWQVQETERQKEALRKFYERERPVRVDWKTVALLFGCVFVVVVAVYWWAFAPLMYRVFGK